MGLQASQVHHGPWACQGPPVLTLPWALILDGPRKGAQSSPQAAQDGRAWALEGSGGCKEEDVLGETGGRHPAQAPGQGLATFCAHLH